jgi:hypothetical protein
MAVEKISQVKRTYLLYTEFKDKFDKLDKEDQNVLQPYLQMLFQNWCKAINRQNKENNNDNR